MTRSELHQTILGAANRFKGVESDILAYTFPNVGQATMFAQYIIWDKQVTAVITSEGDLIDNPNVPTIVTLRR